MADQNCTFSTPGCSCEGELISLESACDNTRIRFYLRKKGISAMTEVELILNRSGNIGKLDEIQGMNICETHRFELTTEWEEGTCCSYPGHASTDLPSIKVDRELSERIFKELSVSIPVGSGLCNECNQTVCDELSDSSHQHASTGKKEVRSSITASSQEDNDGTSRHSASSQSSSEQNTLNTKDTGQLQETGSTATSNSSGEDTDHVSGSTVSIHSESEKSAKAQAKHTQIKNKISWSDSLQHAEETDEEEVHLQASPQPVEEVKVHHQASAASRLPLHLPSGYQEATAHHQSFQRSLQHRRRKTTLGRSVMSSRSGAKKVSFHFLIPPATKAAKMSKNARITDVYVHFVNGKTTATQVGMEKMNILQTSKGKSWKEAHLICEVDLPGDELRYKYSYKENSGLKPFRKQISYQEKNVRLTRHCSVIDSYDDWDDKIWTKGRLFYINNRILSDENCDMNAILKEVRSCLFQPRDNGRRLVFRTFMKWLNDSVSSKHSSLVLLIYGICLGYTLKEQSDFHRPTTAESIQSELKKLEDRKARQLLEVFRSYEYDETNGEESDVAILHLAINLTKKLGGNWFHVLDNFYSSLSAKRLISSSGREFGLDQSWNDCSAKVAGRLIADFFKSPTDEDIKKLFFSVMKATPMDRFLEKILPKLNAKDGSAAIFTSEEFHDVNAEIRKKIQAYVLSCRPSDVKKVRFVWVACREIPSLSGIVRRQLMTYMKDWSSNSIPDHQTVESLITDPHLYDTPEDMVNTLTACCCDCNFHNGGDALLLSILRIQDLYDKLIEANILSYKVFSIRPLPAAEITHLVTDPRVYKQNPRKLLTVLNLCLGNFNEGGIEVLKSVLETELVVTRFCQAGYLKEAVSLFMSVKPLRGRCLFILRNVLKAPKEIELVDESILSIPKQDILELVVAGIPDSELQLVVQFIKSSSYFGLHEAKQYVAILKGRNQTLQVNSTLMLDLLSYLVDQPWLHDMQEIDVKNDCSVLQRLHEEESLWVTIFKASGKYANELQKSSEGCTNVLMILSDLMKRVQEKRVNIPLLEKMREHKSSLDNLLTVTLIVQKRTKSIWEKTFSEAVICSERFRQDVNNFKTIIPAMKAFDDVIRISGREETGKDIEQKWSSYVEGNIDLCRTEQEEFLGVLFAHREQARLLSHPSRKDNRTVAIKSQVFLNIARNVLQVRASDLEGKASLDQCINFLAVDALDEYQELTSNKSNLGSLSVAKVKVIFMKEPAKVKEDLESMGVKPKMMAILQSIFQLDKMCDHPHVMENVFEAFGINNETEKFQAAVGKLAKATNESDKISVHDLYQACSQISKVYEILDNDEWWTLLRSLSASAELINFIKGNTYELKEMLQEANEESHNSDNLDEDSELLLYFYDVYDWIQPLFRQTTAESLMKAILRTEDVPRYSTKIKTSLNGLQRLQDLYESRVEKEEAHDMKIIQKTNRSGSYHFVLDKHVCQLRLRLEGDSLGVNELRKLRSRALLSSKTHQNDLQYEKSPEDQEKQTFIDTVDQATEIVDLGRRLQENGHFGYMQSDSYRWETETSVPQLQQLQEQKNTLKNNVTEWEQVLKLAREKFYFLNYVHSKQLWSLWLCLARKRDLTEDVESILSFIIPGIQLERESLRQFYIDCQDTSLAAQVESIGEALHKLANEYAKGASEARCFPFAEMDQKGEKREAVESGKIFYAELDENSSSSVHVMLELYRNTNQRYPRSFNVVFCHDDTGFEEIQLLLNRCLFAKDNNMLSELYCIVNPEQLSPEAQYQLLMALNEFESQARDFLLGIIFRAESDNMIVDQFRACKTHKLSGLSENDMKECFTNSGTKVTIVISDEPGQGKTEYIVHQVTEEGADIRHITVSGPISKRTIIEKMTLSQISKDSALHFNVCSMSDPLLFDSFMFELLVLGVAKWRTLMCGLAAQTVYIEVENTFNNELINQLTLCSYFKKHHIALDNVADSFIVSKEQTSPEQVVCRYYQSLIKKSLDKQDLKFQGDETSPLLSQADCRLLLKQLIDEFNIPSSSFPILTSFLSLAAQEFRRLSVSVYFETGSLENAEYKSVRSTLTKALLGVAKQYSTPSIAKSKKTHRSGTTAMVDRIDNMTKWAHTDQLLILFHRKNSQSATPIYGDLKQVSGDVHKVFELQNSKKLPDFNCMSPDELQDTLEMICRVTTTKFDRSKLEDLEHNYVLTPDNMLKMLLIHMRISSHQPVIIMGETGCGKTSLITYLSRVCEIPLKVFNVHAGRTEKEIEDFVEDVINNAEKEKEIWVFFDEINTCDHLELLNEVICHRMIHGIYLPFNIRFLAACNPYVLKIGKETTEGLETDIKPDDMSRLVYRVHPLPESMLPHVWDFGSLNDAEEGQYIERMVQKLLKTDDSPFKLQETPSIFAELLCTSQRFTRESDVAARAYCVSLRDVDRCIRLAKWFRGYIQKTSSMNKRRREEWDTDEFRSLLLALTHCYHSRLSSPQKRQEYRSELAQFVSNISKDKKKVQESFIAKLIEDEQMRLLSFMKLPTGIAKNEALRENVFVILVCILNRIPVFVVGKPGCSKTLSMQIICSNMKGKSSPTDFFKDEVELIFYVYQGTKNSTSAGIEDVFNRAKMQYRKQDDIHQKRLPLVLLDKVGLAETSQFNPLKVLHSLLEPSSGSSLDIAVVGLSNWALDAAKMNRAIYLSRPEPSEDDLCKTAESIQNAISKKLGYAKLTRELAAGYHSYQQKQSQKNFHGLRDFYGLVKDLAASPVGNMEDRIHEGLQRNFGGLSVDDMELVFNTFADKLKFDFSKPYTHVTRLIQTNLEKKETRHLMLITTGNAALSVLDETVKTKKYVVQIGSRFVDDINSEVYSYNVLSDIKFYIQQGFILILQYMDPIYGSLYDMLNQNYTIRQIGSGNVVRVCRIALGAENNPSCQVHDDFRCVVLLDKSGVRKADPPLLNRFEKQRLSFSDILQKRQRAVVKKLNQWIESYSSIEGLHVAKDMKAANFLGLDSDTMPSLVWRYRHLYTSSSNDDDSCNPEIERKCKVHLLTIATPDGVLRACRRGVRDEKDLQEIKKIYFEFPIHRGLKNYLEQVIKKKEFTYFPGYEKELEKENNKLVVYTHSTIHANIKQMLHGVFDANALHILKLRQVKSVRQFEGEIKHFLGDEKQEMFILQCSGRADSKHIQLAKCKFDEYFQAYYRKRESQTRKFVCIVVHIDRRQAGLDAFGASFLGEWCLATVNSLEPSNPPLADILKVSDDDIFDGNIWSIDQMIRNELQICFSRITYEQGQPDRSSVDDVVPLTESISKNTRVMEFMTEHVKTAMRARLTKSNTKEDKQFTNTWLVDVACDIELIGTHNTLVGAAKEHVRRLVQVPLTQLVILMEEGGIWNCMMNPALPIETVMSYIQDNRDLLQEITSSLPVLIDAKQSYAIGNLVLNYQYPLFAIIHSKIIKECENVFRQHEEKEEEEEDNDEAYKENIITSLREYISSGLGSLINKDILTKHLDVFLSDLSLHSSVQELKIDGVTEATRYLITQLEISEADRDPHGVQTQWYDQDPALVLARCFVSLRFHFEEIRTKLLLITSLCNSKGDKGEKPLAVLQKLSKEKDETEALVDLVCRSYLPSKKRLPNATLENVQSWASSATVIISAAYQLFKETHSWHFLCLCRKIAVNVIITEKAEVKDLTSLADSFNSKEKTIGSQRIFKKVKDISKKLAYDEDSLLCDYFTSCLREHSQPPILNTILAEITTENGLRRGARSVLHDILELSVLEEDVNNVKGTYNHVIREGLKGLNHSDTMKIVDNCLQKQPSIDSPLTCVCADVIQEIAYSDDSFADIHKKDTPLIAIRNVRSAKKGSLQFVTSIALLRAYLSKYCEVMKKGIALQKTDELEKVLSVFSTSEQGIPKERTMAMQVYFLKVFCFNNGLYETCRKWNELQDKDTKHSLDKIDLEPNEMPSVLAFNPMNYAGQYDKFYPEFVEGDRMTLPIQSTEERFSLLAVTTSAYYLSRTLRRPDYTTKQRAAKISNLQAVTTSDPKYRSFLNKVLGVTDFKFNMFQLTDTKKEPEKVHQVSVLIHLTSILVSTLHEKRISFGSQLMNNKNRFLPGAGETTSVLDKNIIVCDVFVCQCKHDKCGYKVMVPAGSDFPALCGHNEMQQFRKPTQEDQRSKEDSKKYVLRTNCRYTEKSCTRACASEAIRNLSPAAYRILRFLVHGCLLVGVEFDWIHEDDIYNTFDLSRADSVYKYLERILADDWHALQVILQNTIEETALFVHSVLHKARSLLTEKKDFQDRKQRDAFEREFTQIVDVCSTVEERKTFGSDIIDQKQDTSHLLLQLKEFDETGQHDLPMACLLRHTRSISFADLEADLLGQSRDTRQRFPFLTLFLRRYRALELVKHLIPIAKWAIRCSKKCKQRLTIKKAETLKCITYLEDERFIPIDERDGEERMFQQFAQAWNCVYEQWEDITGRPKPAKFIRMTGQCRIAACLLHKTAGSSDQINVFIKELVSVQNAFLEEAMSIAVCHKSSHHALGCLLPDTRNAARLPIRTLQTEIMDKPLRHSEPESVITLTHEEGSCAYFNQSLCDIDTTYGRGRVVDYNFRGIEEKLGQVCVLRKALLDITDIHALFTYQGELFHNCATILEDVRSRITQEKVAKNIISRLHKEQEKTKQFAGKALEHTELLLWLLKDVDPMTDNVDPETPIKAYLESHGYKASSIPSTYLPIMDYPDDPRLKHVVALYEELELMLSPIIKDSLDAHYCEENVPHEIKDRLLDQANIDDLKNVHSKISRFMVRYLRFGVQANDYKCGLVQLMESTVGRKIPSLREFFKDEDVRVEHLGQLLTVIEGKIEQAPLMKQMKVLE